MKRVILATLASIAFTSPVFSSDLERLTPEYNKVKEFIHWEPHYLNETTRRDNDYLIRNVLQREDILDFVDNPEKGERRLYSKLNVVSHMYGPNISKGYLEDPEVVHELVPGQIIRVELMVQALESRRFRKQIGKQIEKDLDNEYSEIGGIVIFRNGKIHFRDIKSELYKEKDKSNNVFYSFPLKSLKDPKMAEYHIHAARENSSNSAGPSLKFDEEGEMKADIGRATNIVYSRGEYHGFVITKLKDKKFNIDYYGGVIHEDGIPRVKVLDLGIYPY